ncbi:hypothetical protein ABW20_dc0108773 [Dactylellina cionopaga]|nr:hypothetical protein ABW20_dc0108773 [Dactylellina cionopaga]
MHKRRPSSMSALSYISASNKAPSMGLFDEFGHLIGVLVDCFLEIHVIGLRNHVSLRILFRNKSGSNVQNATFRARTATSSVVTSAECYVDVNGQSTGGLEYRDITEFCHQGSTFECDIGSIQANRDCVVFLRYQHDVVIENEAAVVRFPLPGRRGEKFIARQKTELALWNASQMFSFIALDVKITDFPAKITNVSSSHSVYASIVEESSATVEIDDYIFQGQDDVVFRILSEPFGNKSSSNKDAKSSDATSIHDNIPVINVVVDETATDLDESGDIQEPEALLITELEGKLESRLSSRRSNTPSNIEVERLYSDIRDLSTIRSSYSSSSEESTSSTRSERLRRRKTTVHIKHNSNASAASSSPTDMSEMSWLEDPSDDEVNDEAERIFEEYSSVAQIVAIRDSITIMEDFDVKECKSISIVRPHRPKLITIPSSKIPPMSLDNFTPPSSPIRATFDSKDRYSVELLRELDNLFDRLNNLIHESPTPYFLLNERFANILGLQLQTLRTHPGMQSINLPDTPSWIKEGVWANAIALQFLRCVMDSPFFKTLNEEIRSEYRSLYSIIELPFSSHIQHLSPAASLTRLSEEVLLEMASEIIQEELIEGDEYPTESVKQPAFEDPFVRRPLSPPKTPDDDDRKKADLDAFVDCFEF